MVRDGACRHTKTVMVAVAMRVFVAVSQEPLWAYGGAALERRGQKIRDRKSCLLVFRMIIMLRQRAFPRSVWRSCLHGI